MISPVEWDARDTVVLANPATPGLDLPALEARLRRLFAGEAHVWLSTSGTTGQVKWIALGQKALLASAAGVNAHLRSSASDVWIHALPHFHVGGLGIWARAHLSGAKVVEGLRAESGARRWDASAFLAAAVRERATLAPLVPTQLHDLVALGARAPDSLRAVIVGGGALAPALREKAIALGWPAMPSYGLTECCSQVATGKSADSEELELLPHVSVRVGAEGRLELQSEALLTGQATLSDAGDTFTAHAPGAWFRTEDRGYVHDRRIELLGRDSAFVKIGGESVDLNRLDRVLEELRLERAFRADAVLVAVPDERLGHVIHGASNDASANALFEAFNARVLPFERARQVHVVPEIPRTALGKLKRAELSALLARR